MKAYLGTRLEQYKKTFPNYELIGWYSTASEVQPGDLVFHEHMCEMNESLLYLVLDPVQALVPGNRELPILLHESEIHVVDEKPTMCFAKVGSHHPLTALPSPLAALPPPLTALPPPLTAHVSHLPTHAV